ncbi:glucosaminidase domain-containing protein [Pelagibius sp. Alg239-R121]|uniref:glucosaminidase domain-containing protein n=1 Tax=Pelagibius sp. Alg239-R121 TaxID=2993448 RepID=UPI0024A64E6E|nr:glucosaminidase domain-containing protein [Pelagibius sp. Alg239-R121]
MTVRTCAMRLVGASAIRRTSFGVSTLLLIAAVGLSISVLLSGLPVSGLLTGDRGDQDHWQPLIRPEVVRPVTVDHLEALLDQADFDLEAIRADTALVPRMYVRRLPNNLVSVTDTQRRKRLFFGTLLPLILMANEELRADRAHGVTLRERYPKLSMESGIDQLEYADRQWLAAVNNRYGTEIGDWQTLLARLDELPVSLIMAQAIQESGWGTSRFARDGNALFGQRTWNPEEDGIVPDLRAEGETYRVKSFPDLMAAIRAYMLNINTHDAYRDLRRRRAKLRQNSVGDPGLALASTLTRYSEENAGYVKALSGLIRDNSLRSLNGARLGTSPDLMASGIDADS